MRRQPELDGAEHRLDQRLAVIEELALAGRGQVGAEELGRGEHREVGLARGVGLCAGIGAARPAAGQ